jgi:quinohemoprotein ethanol dehydrogenase
VKNPGKAQMRALDPLTGKTVWAADMQSWQDRSGALVTAGGVMVHGNVAGQLVVRDAANGRIVKTIDTGTSILAAPMTYTIGKPNISPWRPVGAAGAFLRAAFCRRL